MNTWDQTWSERFELIRANLEVFAPEIAVHGPRIYLTQDDRIGSRLGKLPIEAVLANLVCATLTSASRQYAAVPMDPGFAHWVVWLIWLTIDPQANEAKPKLGWTMYEGNPDMQEVHVQLQREPWAGEMHGRGLARYLLDMYWNEVVALFERAWRVVYVSILSVSTGSRGQDLDEFRPARWFPKGMRPRLRKACSDKNRKSRFVRSRKENGVVEYSVVDAKRHWPDEFRSRDA